MPKASLIVRPHRVARAAAAIALSCCCDGGDEFPVPTETFPAQAKKSMFGRTREYVHSALELPQASVLRPAKQNGRKIRTFPALSESPVAPNWNDIRYARPNSRFRDTHNTFTIKVKAEIGFAVDSAGC